MKNYKWSGWGVLPLILSDSEKKKILTNKAWKHWSDDLSDIEIKDLRRFYTRAGAAVFRPLKNGRYELNLADTVFEKLVTHVGENKVELIKLELIIFDGAVLLYFYMDSTALYRSLDISAINRSVFSWQPRTYNSKVTLWENTNNESKPLITWVSDLLSLNIDSGSHYAEDVFGHELASCTWIKCASADDRETLCVSELSAGIKINDPRYQLSECELERLKGNQFSYWNDWKCQFNLNRLVFVEDEVDPSPLFDNISKYYIDLYSVVLFQRMMLTHFKDELLLGEESERKKLYKGITAFRRHYKISHMSTYPFAEKLYQYLCTQANLDYIEEATFRELDHSHTNWKQNKEETNSKILLYISLIAAVLLPISSIATVFALAKEQMSFVFWLCSGIGTGVTLAAVFFPLLKKRLSGKENKLN